MRVLILTGRFGQGHVSCARAIGERVRDQLPGVQVEVVDFLAEALGSDALYRAFGLLVSHGEQVFNRLYYRSESGEDKFGLPMQRFCFGAFSRILERVDPQVVISTLPLTTQLAGRYKAAGLGRYTLLVAVTDTALHGDWVTAAADAYLVPGEDTRRALMAAGIAPHSIMVAGVPVGASFYPEPGKALSPDIRRLLILGGGLGLIPDDLDFYARLDALPGVETTVVCAHNQKLLAQLAGRFDHVRAVGFVDDMAHRMRGADLALGKPGGVTLFEAVACRLPFLSVQPFLAQEIYNARFIETHGLGAVLAGDVEQSVPQIAALLWDDARLTAMGDAMAALEQGFDREALVALIRLAARTAA